MTEPDPFTVRIEQMAAGAPEQAPAATPDPLDGLRLVSTRDAIAEFIERAQRGDEGTIDTGWPGVDQGMEERIYPQEVILVVARTSVGKTWVLQHLIGRALSHDPDHRAVLFPLEMAPYMMAHRILANALSASPRDVKAMARAGEIDPDETVAHHGYLNRLSFVEGSITVDQIIPAVTAAGEAWAAPATIIAVDYVGLLRWGGHARASLYERASEHARELKAITQRLDVVMLGAVQLSRAGGGAGDRAPTLDAMRDSGVIEEAADRILAFWRNPPDAEETSGDAGDQVNVRLLKNRHGPLGRDRVLQFDYARRLREYEYELEGPDHKQRAAGELVGHEDDIPY